MYIYKYKCLPSKRKTPKGNNCLKIFQVLLLGGGKTRSAL